MNVYDFDGTIYKGDSSVDFYKFVARREPAILKELPTIIEAFLKYSLNKLDKKTLKENYFSFLCFIDGATYVELFWKKYRDRILQWYLKQQQEDDVIISASPEFLLTPICKQIGVTHLIASKVDIHTGKFLSPNCKGEDKARLFRKKYPNEHIDHFYSDSESDRPLAYEADKAFLVKNGMITEWKLRKSMVGIMPPQK